ncbi:MAG: cell filamentation protein Fic [Cytophagales bacterium CG12_big_fil_rev_8_21_14_0_65_40_12]|nr:MAG: cell filamentation protein Fic [Cytophagales bacterium CG12_big_fil_rev_8_21_14_0_65_40_12]PIW04943.1 MAG: Fic family protein [Cytophagales bacterium CG17_big_fil_post_rev_8_21_14_2_50_40_13]
MKSIESYIAEYEALELHKVVDYDKFNQFAITAHSTQIEGATLTLEETSLLIDEGITPKGKPLEHSLMVRDHHQALLLAIKFGLDRDAITQDSICQLNAAVLKSTGQKYNTALGIVDASKGELRRGSVLVQNRYFPAYNKLPDLLKKLTEDLNDRMDKNLSQREKIDLSYSAHFNLVSIHPHYDGNGRTSRLLMNQLQTRFGLPISCVFKEDKKEYYEALEASRLEGTITPFKEFMDYQYKKHLSSEIKRYKSYKKKGGMGMSFLY